jgi:hypothetical protein
MFPLLLPIGRSEVSGRGASEPRFRQEAREPRVGESEQLLQWVGRSERDLHAPYAHRHLSAELEELQPMLPQVACASSVRTKPRRRSAHMST